MQAVRSAPAVRQVLDDLRTDHARAIEELRHLVQIPAPPFKEQRRAEYVVKRFRELGLADASVDQEGNAVGIRKGTGNGPRLVVSAHLDTVFPEGTDLTVREEGGRLYAPGISDDTRGVTVLLSWLKALNERQLQTVGDIVFVANVGEEELGNLRGMKALFREHADIDGMVGLEPGDGDGILNQGTGSHRYEVAFKGPGGHSFAAFGQVPSAIHAMGRAIAHIGDVQVPSDPKTTFTVGKVGGGTSVNTIAGDATMAVDIRSNALPALLQAEGLGQAGQLQPLDLQIRPGEVVGLAGLLGAGRTELARLLFGLEQPDRGMLRIDGHAVAFSNPMDAIRQGLALCPEERKTDGIVAELSVRENIALALQARMGVGRFLSRAEQTALAERYVQLLGIKTASVETPIGLLSGGNQQKAILARWLATEPRLLILDEPTRGIDVAAKQEIMDQILRLAQAGMAVLFISSEMSEVVRVAHRIVVLRDRHKVGELPAGSSEDDIYALIADHAHA
nr:M20/M25/M40 family metallo-hydrolase [Paracidovorax cattleyae]